MNGLIPPRIVPRAMVPLIACMGLGGCAALPLSVLGSVAGAAGSAFPTGQEIFSLGKLDSSERATFEQAISAASRAADELGLHGAA